MVIIMRKNKKDYDALDLLPSVNNVVGQPQNSIEQINKYGTYNIQPTGDSDNSFPKIAQGLAKPESRKKMKIEDKKSRDIF